MVPQWTGSVRIEEWYSEEVTKMSDTQKLSDTQKWSQPAELYREVVPIRYDTGFQPGEGDPSR